MSSTSPVLAIPKAAQRVEYAVARPSTGRRALKLARQKPLGVVALVIIVLILGAAIFADVIAPYDPLQMHGTAVMQPPSERFIMGTDNLGRDMFSRIIHGSRISLAVGISSVVLSLVIGVFLGMVSGYFEGRVDMIIQRIMDAALAFPGIVFALAVLAALGPGLVNVSIAIAFTMIPRNNRIVRGSVLSEKQSLYVEAARVSGCGGNSVMWRHILPNVTAPIIIIAATELGTAVLLEATLSFLGVGVPPPQPSWGGMLSGAHRTYMLIAPWMAIFPGIAISLAVLGWNLLGDVLRDIWDPRLRQA
jgi:ABC-type dipeptide/oligopeptide/nickel transport system permease subunit